MNKILILLISFITAIYNTSYSQEEKEEKTKKIRFGLDIGAHIFNNKPSQFLDGSHPFGVSRIINNPIQRQQIEAKLGYPIKGLEYSRNNTYTPTVFAGLYIGYDLNPEWSIVMKLNLSVIRFSTPLIIALDNPRNFTGEFEQATVTAQEQRFEYGLGIQRTYVFNSKIKFSLSAGGSFNYIQLEKQELVIRGVQYIITRIQSPQTLNFEQVDGFGYGLFAETGMLYGLNEKFSLGLFIQGSLTRNKQYIERLTEGTSYLRQSVEKASGFLPSFSSGIRVIWN